jgi:hypothetical protein
MYKIGTQGLSRHDKRLLRAASSVAAAMACCHVGFMEVDVNKSPTIQC